MQPYPIVRPGSGDDTGFPQGAGTPEAEILQRRQPTLHHIPERRDQQGGQPDIPGYRLGLNLLRRNWWTGKECWDNGDNAELGCQLKLQPAWKARSRTLRPQR